jgi:hypothetical protein
MVTIDWYMLLKAVQSAVCYGPTWLLSEGCLSDDSTPSESELIGYPQDPMYRRLTVALWLWNTTHHDPYPARRLEHLDLLQLSPVYEEK